METEKLMHEIEEVQAKIESLSTRRPYTLNNIFFHVGLFFFLIFLISITQTSNMFNALSVLSFLVLSTTLLKTTADIFYFKQKDSFHLFLGIVLLLLVGISYAFIWIKVFSYHALLLWVLLGVIILLCSGFYLLHGYMSYLRNTAKNESFIVALIVVAVWLCLLVAFLYTNMLTYLLLIIGTLVLMKAVYDFSQQFVRREE